MYPKVSVIMPTYNYARFLPEAIESVLKQTFTNWELIIVDDGSTDETNEVVKPYLLDARVKYIYQRNRGLPAARNMGLKASAGEYIQFLDADDLIHAEKLQRQSRFLDNNPDVDVVFSEYAFFKNDVRDTIEPPFRRFNSDIKKDMLTGNFIVVNSTLTRKKAIDAVGGYDETLTSTEDWDLWLRLLLSGMVFVKIRDRMAFVRLHQRRMTTNILNMYFGRYWVIKKTLTNIPKGSIYWQAAKECYVKSKLALTREYLCRGKFKEAIAVLRSRPHFLSLRGVVNFIVETIMNFKTFKQRV